jgi:hypothetical protein
MAALPSGVVDHIQDGIRRTAPLARCTVCRDRPVVGAALTALDLAGGTAASTRRVRRVLDDQRIRDVPS